MKSKTKVLENKADELTMYCCSIICFSNPKMLETSRAQFGLGNDEFMRELERCFSINSTVFAEQTKQPNDGKDDDDATNND